MLSLGVAMLVVPLARADEGHSHDEPSATVAHVLPRFAAVSDAFELVGQLDGRRLLLWLDHAADNRPADGARLQLEIDGHQVAVLPLAAGAFQATLPAVPAPGVLAITATVALGAESDLLAGELDLHGPADNHAEGARRRWVRRAAIGTGAAVLAIAAALLLRRRTTEGAAA